MSIDIEHLQRQIDDLRVEQDQLRARLDALERQRWAGEPRLGPAPETEGEIRQRTDRLVAQVKKAMEEAPPVDRSKLCTTDGRPVAEARASQTNETGQHASYIVLCPEERAKGFVRPYRDRYKHVGSLRCRQCGATSPTTSCDVTGFACDMQRSGGCGTVTTMGRSLSETYARDPGFYGATFCCGCNRHLPVAEFVWTADGERVGS